MIDAINHQSNIIASNNDNSEVKVAIIGIIVTVIGIILSSAITLILNNYNNNHSDNWNKLLYDFGLNKMAVNGVHVFRLLIWKPLIHYNIVDKLNNVTISKKDFEHLGFILGTYHCWKIYLNPAVSNVKLINQYLSSEIKILNDLNDIINIVKRELNDNEINKTRKK